MPWSAALDGGAAATISDAAIAFSADGKLLTATSVGASTVSIFSATDGSVVKSALAPQHGVTQDVAFSHDQSLLGVASGDGLQLWRTHDWTQATILGPGLSLSSLSFSPIASRAAAAGANGIVYQWCDLPN
jgi:WD40 repeat protein